jgi:hypothetical protein
MPLGTYLGSGYLQLIPWRGWISQDTTLATSWASSSRDLARIPHGLPQHRSLVGEASPTLQRLQRLPPTPTLQWDGPHHHLQRLQ